MANHKSALKKVRQDAKRRERNRSHRAKLRTAIKKLRQALDRGDKDTAARLLTPTLALVDRGAQTGILHRNAADRTKSRLQRAYNRASA